MTDVLERHPLPWRVMRRYGEGWDLWVLEDDVDRLLMVWEERELLELIAATMNASVVKQEAQP